MESTDIANNGDLILAVNGNRHLRVCSVVLCNTSKVFKALLSSDFAEGQTFRNNDTSTPTTVPLADDDPEGMLLLCAGLHLRHEEKIEPEALLSFAILADKYDCAHPLKHLAEHWLGAMSSREISYRAFYVVKAAYLLDHAKYFAGITSRLPNEKDHYHDHKPCLLKLDDSDPLHGFYGMYSFVLVTPLSLTVA